MRPDESSSLPLAFSEPVMSVPGRLDPPPQYQTAMYIPPASTFRHHGRSAILGRLLTAAAVMLPGSVGLCSTDVALLTIGEPSCEEMRKALIDKANQLGGWTNRPHPDPNNLRGLWVFEAGRVGEKSIEEMDDANCDQIEGLYAMYVVGGLENVYPKDAEGFPIIDKPRSSSKAGADATASGVPVKDGPPGHDQSDPSHTRAQPTDVQDDQTSPGTNRTWNRPIGEWSLSDWQVAITWTIAFVASSVSDTVRETFIEFTASPSKQWGGVDPVGTAQDNFSLWDLLPQRWAEGVRRIGKRITDMMNGIEPETERSH